MLAAAQLIDSTLPLAAWKSQAFQDLADPYVVVVASSRFIRMLKSPVFVEELRVLVSVGHPSFHFEHLVSLTLQIAENGLHLTNEGVASMYESIRSLLA